MKLFRSKNQTGVTIFEALVLLLIFSSMFLVMISTFKYAFSKLSSSKVKLVAIEIANAQMEILRNVDYNDLGTTTGSPQGTILPNKQVTRSGTEFNIKTTIKYYDDPFDGCAGEVSGEPTQSMCADGTIVEKLRDIPANQNNPADYKKCDIEVSWEGQYSTVPVKFSTNIAPRDLEGETDKGFLLIEVINADGAPVVNATVEVTNTQVDPNVNISMETNNNGHLLLLDLEPSQNSYVIEVSKSGYSIDRTCSLQADGTECTDSEGVPDPFLRDISVHQGELEEVTLIIDHYSAIAVNSYSQECGPIDNIDFTLSGLDKKISVDPEILKNVINFTTDIGQSPHWSTSVLEWDRYDLLINTPGYDIAGINHDLALNIIPNTSTTVNVLLAPHTSEALLVTVKDSGTGTNLSGANIRVVKDDQTYNESKITGQGFLEQTDWSGGDGQEDFIDETRYYDDNNNIDAISTTGQVSLESNGWPDILDEDFSTGANKDGGNTNADWNVPDQQLRLDSSQGKYPVGETQYAQTNKINGIYGMISTATFQVTEQPNGKTINYFLSADGGTNFESVVPGTPHIFTNVGSDLRVRIELETDDEDITPIVDDFSISYLLKYYDTLGELISSTFDLGEAAPTLSDFTTISWHPVSQPPETGGESVRFQIASNNDNSTWNYIGPDGTDGSYYTGSTADINSSHDGDRYLRYKFLLSTEDEYYSPTLTDVRIGYTLACLPPGQAFFPNMSSGSHVIEVNLEDYENTNVLIDIDGYITEEILLTPIQ